MRVLVCGDRNWTNRDVMLLQLRRIAVGPVTLIQGEARGADLMSASIARTELAEYNWEILCFPADWNKHGRAAGPIRNRQMLKEGKPDLVYAFHNDIQNSKGTKDMVNIAQKAGIPVTIFKEQ